MKLFIKKCGDTVKWFVNKTGLKVLNLVCIYVYNCIYIYINGIGPPYDEFSPVILLQGKPLSTSHVMFVQLSHSKKQMLSAVKSQKTVKEITVEFSHGKD